MAIKVKDFLWRDKDLGDVIEVEVYYKLGGMNYFSGGVNKRGIYLSISPVNISGGMKSFTAFTGIATCIEELNRKSDKRIKYWGEKTQPFVDDIISAFLERGKDAIHIAVAIVKGDMVKTEGLLKS